MVYMPDILPAVVQRFMSIYPSALQVYILYLYVQNIHLAISNYCQGSI